jgi:hypothetical protein
LRRRSNQRHEWWLIDISEIRMPAAYEEIKLVSLRVIAARRREMNDGDQQGRKPDHGLA